MHNTWTKLLLTLNASCATHFCVAPTARKGTSYDLTLAALGKKRKKAARGVRFKSGLLWVLLLSVCMLWSDSIEAIEIKLMLTKSSKRLHSIVHLATTKWPYVEHVVFSTVVGSQLKQHNLDYFSDLWGSMSYQILMIMCVVIVEKTLYSMHRNKIASVKCSATWNVIPSSGPFY